MEERDYKRNRFMFGFGTLGRDMVYILVSGFLMVYITEVLTVSDAVLSAITVILFAARVFDACNDPVMGAIVDSTRTRFGKFKPWIAFGAVTTGALTVLLFTNIAGNGAGYVRFFAVVYLLWGVAYTTNDVSYWGMMPSLTKSLGEREILSSVARICANLGLFAVVVLALPVTGILRERLGGNGPLSWTVFAAAIVAVALFTQCFTIFGVKEKARPGAGETTSLRDMARAIVRNDQLLFTAIAMGLFMIGYVTTTGFGVYYFKYVYRNEGMYSVFALVLGVSQIAAIAVFPLLCKALTRKQVYIVGMSLVAAGYIIFFLAPASMAFIGPAAMLLFVGQAFIQMLMYVSLADAVEYGEYKLGKRNESVSFSTMSFINKMGGAAGSGVLGATLIISGINRAQTPDDVPAEGLLVMKVAMLLLPLILIAASFFIHFAKFRIDRAFYSEIIAELDKRKASQTT